MTRKRDSRMAQALHSEHRKYSAPAASTVSRLRTNGSGLKCREESPMPEAKRDVTSDPPHGNHVEYCAWPSIEAFQELAYQRMREGPGCVQVNGLLIRDPMCPACAAARKPAT